MSTFRLPRFRHCIALLACFTGATAAWAASGTDTDPSDVADGTATTGLSHIIDQLPKMLAQRLPGFDPRGTLQLSVQPHLGDLFHGDYVRLPVGAQWKVTDQFALDGDLTSYVARGFNESGSGLANLVLGAKCEHVMPWITPGGISLGVIFRTPFNDTPLVFTDGYRHIQPYIAATRMLVPRWQLIGFSSLGANFLEHTNLPSNFSRNQLHANSVNFSVGVARAWERIQVSLTARVASTEFTSDQGRQNFMLRPEISIPLRRNLNAPMQFMLTLNGRAMWGPEGQELSASCGFRVRFSFDHKHRDPLEARLPL